MKQPIKYRHPEMETLTWSGIGRRPMWIDAYLELHPGSTLDDLLVKQASPEDEALDLDILGASNPVTTPQVALLTKPATLGERAFAGRIAAGLAALPEEGDTGFTPGVRTALAAVTETNNQNARLAGIVERVNSGSSDEAQIRLSEWMGQRKFSSALQKLLTVSDLVELQKMKDSKAYKGLKVLSAEGSLLTVSSFGEVCSAIGGSEQHINEQLLNLRVFGPGFMEFADQSLGYREMRSLRKVPEDERAALIEAATAGDKDQLLDLVESMMAKHAKAKETLQAEKAGVAADLAAEQRFNANLTASLERAEIQVKGLLDGRRLTQFEPRTEDMRAECMALQLGAELPMNALRKLIDETVAEDTAAPEWALRMDHLWIAAHAVLARAIDLVEDLRGLCPVDGVDMPDRPRGEHILTQEEALRWVQDYALIENRFEAQQAVRQQKRDEAKPKGPGRPKGSANKAKE